MGQVLLVIVPVQIALAKIFRIFDEVVVGEDLGFFSYCPLP